MDKDEARACKFYQAFESSLSSVFERVWRHPERARGRLPSLRRHRCAIPFLCPPDRIDRAGRKRVDGLRDRFGGNIFVSGSSAGDFDGVRLVGTSSALLQKYDASGQKLWTRVLGVSHQSVTASAVATDATGNAYLTGATGGSLDGTTHPATSDAFLIKYDPSGARLWTQQFGTGGLQTRATSVAVDFSGNVYVGGSTSRGLDGNTLSGDPDLFIIKYSPSGVRQWTQEFGQHYTALEIKAITTDTLGNVYVAGYADGGVDGNPTLGSYQAILVKYDSSGVKQWSRQPGVSAGSTEAFGAASYGSDNIYVTGYTSAGLDGNSQMGLKDLFLTKYDGSGTRQWTRQLGASGVHTTGNFVAVGPSGNIYVAGQTDGSLPDNTITGTTDAFASQYLADGTRSWIKQSGSAGLVEQANSVSIDSGGNVFLSGYSGGRADQNIFVGSAELFLKKYLGSGTAQWSRRQGAEASRPFTAQALARDDAGDTFLAGYTQGSVNGAPYAGNTDLVLVKFDANGRELWTAQLGDAASLGYAYGLAVSGSGEAYVVGMAAGGIDGHGAAGPDDVFIVKYDSSGNKQWSRQLGSGGVSAAKSVAVSPMGGIYVAGYASGALPDQTQVGLVDGFVRKYDSQGNLQWASQFGRVGASTSAFAVAAAADGAVYLGGQTNGPLDGQPVVGTNDAFILKLDGAGAQQWIKKIGVPAGNTAAYSLSTDKSGDVVAVGKTQGGLDGNAPMGNTDMFVTRYSASGQRLWTQQFGAHSLDSTVATSVTTDPSGNAYVAGWTSAGLDGNALVSPGMDLFISKFNSLGFRQWTRQTGPQAVPGGGSEFTSAQGVVFDCKLGVELTASTTGSLDGSLNSAIYNAVLLKF